VIEKHRQISDLSVFFYYSKYYNFWKEWMYLVANFLQGCNIGADCKKFVTWEGGA
jgi:hypothetical protein